MQTRTFSTSHAEVALSSKLVHAYGERYEKPGLAKGAHLVAEDIQRLAARPSTAAADLFLLDRDVASTVAAAWNEDTDKGPSVMPRCDCCDDLQDSRREEQWWTGFQFKIWEKTAVATHDYRLPFEATIYGALAWKCRYVVGRSPLGFV